MALNLDVQLSRAKDFLNLYDGDSDPEDECVEATQKVNAEDTVTPKNEEIVSSSADDNDGFTKVGPYGKAVKKTEPISYTQAAKVGLPEKKVEVSSTNEPETSEEIMEPLQITFGTVDKTEFDKSKGNKPNFTLNPELFQKAVYEISKKLGTNIFPDADLFADKFNKQPGVKNFYHYDKFNRDENFDAFSKDWSEFKNVYANFFWGKMDDVIDKAQTEKVNLLTFLDVSEENSSVLPYFKLYKQYCQVQYNFSNINDLWVHASETGFDKFSTPHLPKKGGKYALCFFNFGDNKIVKTSHSIVSEPEDGRLQHKVSTKISPSNGEVISAFKYTKSKDGTVRITRSVSDAINTSHEDGTEVDELMISNESLIKTLEIEIESSIKEKDLKDELQLYQKKKEHFEREIKNYENFLQKFKLLL